MRVEGRERAELPRPMLWRRLVDPEWLRRSAPGLEELRETAPGRFDALLRLRVPALQGEFRGTLEFVERVEPERLRLRLDGKGAPGFVQGDVTVRLEPDGAGTLVEYVADVNVGGAIGRLGQRMLSGVTKEMAGQFFQALARGEAEASGAAPSAARSFFQLVWRLLLRVLGRSPRA